MTETQLVDRLADMPRLAEIPREELEWLVAHGDYELLEAGTVVAPLGQRIETLWILLSGTVAVYVDRGVGSRRVIEWHAGDVSGMLPYSRMSGPPGDNFTEAATELVTIHESLFPEMIHRCPTFTALTVHLMLDRARRFNASDLQDEKMISLGRLAAGLAHELNNPASAAARGAKLLLSGLDEAEAASRALGAAGLTEEVSGRIRELRATCLARPVDRVLSPIQQADREDEISDWLVDHQLDPDQAGPLAETAVAIDDLDTLAAAVTGATLEAAIRWIVTGCATHSLVLDIEKATTRIHELVAAVKRFTYMDSRGGADSVDVEEGLRDTIRVMAAKARSKGASVTLEVEADLPHVRAAGGELNQVWVNLIDNAVEAIGDSGHVDIRAATEVGRVVVRVIDDGPGIPPDVMPRIFDPFFTTKPPGQGTGLGLEIARRLLRQYDGEISVDSRPGRTEFRVSLQPVRPAPTPRDTPPDVTGG